MFTIFLTVAIISAIALFDDINKNSIKNAVDIRETFQLPTIDEPVKYIIDGVPFEINTPNSKYSKTAMKLPVKTLIGKIDGEIWFPKSLEFQTAVALQKLGFEISEKGFKKIKGMVMTITKSVNPNDGNEYYNCNIQDIDDIMGEF